MNGIFDLKVLIRGAGELASGVAHRLFLSNIRKIIMVDTEKPTSERRGVSFSEAIYDGEKMVEGVRGVKVKNVDEAIRLWNSQAIPVMVDPSLSILDVFKPHVLIDAIMAKRNTGTRKSMAKLVIGLGPGFTAGSDVDAVIETKEGHNLGKVIWRGSAEENTGIPTPIMGYAKERLLIAPSDGVIKLVKDIGDMVERGEIVAYVGDEPLRSNIDGVLRGIVRDGLFLKRGKKCGDVDPRGVVDYCFTISDRSRSIAGGVLEAILSFFNHP